MSFLNNNPYVFFDKYQLKASIFNPGNQLNAEEFEYFLKINKMSNLSELVINSSKDLSNKINE